MGEIFLKLLNMSLMAGWLVIAVICFRFIFRRTPKWVNCMLWGIAAIRLICPFSIESAFGLLPNTELIKDTAVVEGEVQSFIPSINSNLRIVKNTVNPMLARSFAYEEYESTAPLQVITFACGIAWCCGMILLMLYAVISLVRLHFLVREAVHYKENIMICDAVKSPFILGNIRPGIYLPSGLNENETEYIVAHERAHLKRKDYWWKPLGYFLLCVYWFNPLCWAAYILFCKDVELACDEKVIRNMDIRDKKEYSRTLLSCARPRAMVLACPLAFGEVGVKERVKSVLNYKKPALWIVSVSIAVCLVIAVCFLTTSPKTYQIRVTIPAGSTESFCYSDEEISPKGNSLTLYSGEGLGDTEVVLLPIEVREENAYDESAYITPGMPVKMDVEKGAWFKIGVNMQNPTAEDIDVYVEVKNVEVRIASVDNSGEKSDQNPGDDEASIEVDIADILELICSSPGEASSPGEYIEAHLAEYDTLVNYEKTTLRYCAAEFMKGGQTDLRGSIMALVCEELLQSKGKIPLDAASAPTGQDWFDTLLAHGSNMLEPYFSPDDYAIMFGEQAETNETIGDKSVAAYDVLLYEQPEADKVCIRVQPSEYRERQSYYYIPTGKDQEWLLSRVKNLDLEGEDFARRWEGRKERGWAIVYNDISLTAFEEGYLYYTYTDDSGIKECLIEEPKLCDYVQILLLEELNYSAYDVTRIRDIVSAKLDVSSHFTGNEFYSQTITDEAVLNQFEEWFRNAEYMYGGADCANESACLELTMESGEAVKLSMATDSCPDFGINGVYYDYRPVQNWDNSEFYKYFDEIPYNP